MTKQDDLNCGMKGVTLCDTKSYSYVNFQIHNKINFM